MQLCEGDSKDRAALSTFSCTSVSHKYFTIQYRRRRPKYSIWQGQHNSKIGNNKSKNLGKKRDRETEIQQLY